MDDDYGLAKQLENVERDVKSMQTTDVSDRELYQCALDVVCADAVGLACLYREAVKADAVPVFLSRDTIEWLRNTTFEHRPQCMSHGAAVDTAIRLITRDLGDLLK